MWPKIELDQPECEFISFLVQTHQTKREWMKLVDEDNRRPELA